MNTKNQVETKTKTYTTSKLADLCGVIVGSISILIKKQNLKPVKIGRNSAKYHDAGVLRQLWLHYARSKLKRDKTNSTQDLRTQLAVAQSENRLLRDQFESAKSATGILQNGLKIKDSQIDKLQDSTNQAQQLDLVTHVQHQELLEQKSQPTSEPAGHKHGIPSWF